jgi:hypothetical protein
LTPGQLDSSAKERVQFNTMTTDYFKARKVRLDGLVTVGNEFSSGRAANLWRQHAEGLVSDEKILQQMLADVSDVSAAATKLKLAIESEEKSFNQGLADFAFHYDDLWSIYFRLQTSEVNYKGRWKILVDKASEIAEIAKAAVTDLVESLGAASYSADAWTGPAERAVKTLNDLAAKASGSVELSALRTEVDACLAAYGDALDDAVPHLTELRVVVDLTKAHIAKLRALQSAEIDTLHRMFREERRNMADYVKLTPLDKAGLVNDAAKGDFGSWISGLPSTPKGGLQKDAEQLRTDVLTSFSTIALDVIDHAYDAFKDQNQGVFMDAVSDATITTLAQTEVWASLRTKVAEVKSADKLRALRDQVSRQELGIEPSLTALASAVAGRADPQTEKDAFLNAVNKRGAELVATLATRRTDLARIVDDGVAQVDGSDLAGLLSRQDIERSLNS